MDSVEGARKRASKSDRLSSPFSSSALACEKKKVPRGIAVWGGLGQEREREHRRAARNVNWRCVPTKNQQSDTKTIPRTETRLRILRS